MNLDLTFDDVADMAATMEPRLCSLTVFRSNMFRMELPLEFCDRSDAEQDAMRELIVRRAFDALGYPLPEWQSNESHNQWVTVYVPAGELREALEQLSAVAITPAGDCVSLYTGHSDGCVAAPGDTRKPDWSITKAREIAAEAAATPAV